jgi:rod shape-determining protein MreD
MFFICFILQSTIFSHLTVAGVKPDLVLILIIFYALLHGPKEGMKIGIIGGLMQDLIFGYNIGMNSVAKVIVGFVFGLLERKIYKENLLIPMVALFLGTFLNETILYVLRMGVGISGSYLASVRNVIFSTAVYNSCLTPFMYGLFYKTSQKNLSGIDR